MYVKADVSIRKRGQTGSFEAFSRQRAGESASALGEPLCTTSALAINAWVQGRSPCDTRVHWPELVVKAQKTSENVESLDCEVAFEVVETSFEVTFQLSDEKELADHAVSWLLGYSCSRSSVGLKTSISDVSLERLAYDVGHWLEDDWEMYTS